LWIEFVRCCKQTEQTYLKNEEVVRHPVMQN
jgi:hypothetical protein